MDTQMTSTRFTLEGYQVVHSLGIVRGITVRSRSIVGGALAKLQTIVGGNITMFTLLCERTREEAFEVMLTLALDEAVAHVKSRKQ